MLPFYPLSDCGLKIAAHLYNRNPRGVVFGKILDDNQKKALTWDVERGAPNEMVELPWQTCNCIGDWHYNTGTYQRGYRTATNLVKQLVDIVSKNGNLLLNIPLRADGTYDEKAAAFLDELEAWMSQNGESIFGTRPWVKFGEGPVAEKDIKINSLARGRQASHQVAGKEESQLQEEHQQCLASGLRQGEGPPD